MNMSNFVKISALTNEDRSKIKTYWTELFGPEFSAAMVEDYDVDGETKKVEASVSSKKKVNG
jgi:hypothetical protein